jgi:hypothetical protein
MNRNLIIIGLLVVVVGLAWPIVSKIPLFRLPGDIVIDRPNAKFFFPLTSMLLISAVASIIWWLLRR